MEFLATLLIYAQNNNISQKQALNMHAHYCQNLYWQSDAEKKMHNADCNISRVQKEISRVTS